MLNRGCFPGIDDPARWVLPCVLREQAERRPDAPWFIGVDGETLSFGQAWADVERVAGLVAALGVTDGEPVVVTAGNYADLVRAWRGLLRLGVVAVLSNTELRGTFQVRQLRNCGTRRAVIDADRLPQFDAVATDVPALTQRLLKGGASPVAFSGKPAGTSTGAFDHWRQVLPWVGPLPRHHHNACVMYSSGTGGPGQGVLMPHAHGTPFGLGGFESVQLQADDPGYAVLPLHHVNGLLMQLGATLLPGTPAIVRRRISASAWMDDIRTHGATIASCPGTRCGGAGNWKYEISVVAHSALMGGNGRVGLEVNLHLSKGVLATCGQLVSRAKIIVESLGAVVASTAESMAMLVRRPVRQNTLQVEFNELDQLKVRSGARMRTPVAIVTAGHQGIGRAIADRFGAGGFQVFACDIAAPATDGQGTGPGIGSSAP